MHQLHCYSACTPGHNALFLTTLPGTECSLLSALEVLVHPLVKCTLDSLTSALSEFQDESALNCKGSALELGGLVH